MWIGWIELDLPGDDAQVQRVLNAAERAVAEQPETQLLSVRRRHANSDD